MFTLVAKGVSPELGTCMHAGESASNLYGTRSHNPKHRKGAEQERENAPEPADPVLTGGVRSCPPPHLYVQQIHHCIWQHKYTRALLHQILVNGTMIDSPYRCRMHADRELSH